MIQLNEEYEKMLYDIKMNLAKTTKPIQYIDTSKLSKREKDEVIKELQNQIHSLQRELLITNSVDARYINGLI